jgi:hypothetical protein
VPHEHVENQVVSLLSTLISDLFERFAARSAVSAPAILIGIGIAAHQTTDWATSGGSLTVDELFELLADIRWEREARHWDGVAAHANAAGVLNFGGAKDAGGRVADALLYPNTQGGRQIRGRQ